MHLFRIKNKKNFELPTAYNNRRTEQHPRPIRGVIIGQTGSHLSFSE